MAINDPRRSSVLIERASRAGDDHEFHALMAEQLRRAPWLMLSLVCHGIALLLLWLWPAHEIRPPEALVHLAPPSEAVDVDELVPPPPDPLEDPILEPDLIQPQSIDPVSDSPSETFDPSPTIDATHAMLTGDLSSPIGLAAGHSGPYGNRGKRGGGRGGTGSHVEETVDLALRWLAAHQDADGSWDTDEFMKHDTQGIACDGPGNPVHDVGVTGLAMLAFLGDGSTLRSGRYRENLKRATAWLRDQQDPKSGLLGAPSSNEFVYDHAIATLALVEAYGLSDYRLLRDNAQRAIDYLEYHRNPYGAWRYQPRDGDNDTSVTGWCLLAYASAKHFDLTVNQSAITLGVTWLEQMTDPVTRRTGYSERGGLSSRRSGEHATRFPRERNECMTAVALFCRVFLGADPQQDKTLLTQARLVAQKPPVWNPSDGSIDHYAWYYGTYALYQTGGKLWSDWEKALDRAVVRTQRKDGNALGSWDPIGVWGEDGGRVYSTALLCLTLEAYYRYSRLVR